jgi:hypothetical protein
MLADTTINSNAFSYCRIYGLAFRTVATFNTLLPAFWIP